MKKYAQEVPQALVARDQLQYSVAELSTHDNQRVTTALNNGLQAALTGSKPPADAMRDAQREATRILQGLQALMHPEPKARIPAPRRESFAWAGRRRHAWLLLLPALTLLVAFTHWPALATVWHSFCSTPKKAPAGALRRPRQLPRHGRGRGVLAGARRTT